MLPASGNTGDPMREADGNARAAISFSVRSKKPKSGSIKFKTIKPTYPSRFNSGLSHLLRVSLDPHAGQRPMLAGAKIPATLTNTMTTQQTTSEPLPACDSSGACECHDLAWMHDGRNKGRYGVATGQPLCKHCVAQLPDYTAVMVVWNGGNGPHIYTVRNDQHPSENEGTTNVSTEDLLSAGGHWIEHVRQNTDSALA